MKANLNVETRDSQGTTHYDIVLKLTRDAIVPVIKMLEKGEMSQELGMIVQGAIAVIKAQLLKLYKNLDATEIKLPLGKYNLQILITDPKVVNINLKP